MTNPQRPPRGLFHLSTVVGHSRCCSSPGLPRNHPGGMDVSFVNCFDARYFAAALGGLRPRPLGYGRESRTN